MLGCIMPRALGGGVGEIIIRRGVVVFTFGTHVLKGLRRAPIPAIGFDGTVGSVDDVASLGSEGTVDFANWPTEGEPFQGILIGRDTHTGKELRDCGASRVVFN